MTPRHSYQCQRSGKRYGRVDNTPRQASFATGPRGAPNANKGMSGAMASNFHAPNRWMARWNAPNRAIVGWMTDRKSTRLNSSHGSISYAVFCLKKKKNNKNNKQLQRRDR